MMRKRLFDLFDRAMGSQWACPHGSLGWLAGKLMERGNASMNELAVETLQVHPGDAVLELGFGPGAALQTIASLVDDGFVAGVDPSRTMIRQASRRLRRYIAAGRVELKEGTSSSIPYPDARFDCVVTVNTIYFWEEPESDLHEMRRVIKVGGHLVVVLRAIKNEEGTLEVHGMPRETSVDEVVSLMHRTGYTNLTSRTREVPFGFSPVVGVALIASAS
jgi:ubiquinone/menaquinone biosynthesis C-methylase UbiE